MNPVIYAKCDDCNKEMSEGNGCTVEEFFAKKRIVYGKDFLEGTQFCHDCNVEKGQYHHAGCDVERCPLCGGQLISCQCDR
jgi:hypothetical protein